MSQKQPIEATVEFLASQHDSLPSASEETAASEPVANSEMPQFAPPSVTGEIGRLGKYRIQKELGRGGMGAVYLAFDERLQRQIALKVMLPKFAANANAKDRFLREARAAAQISSDHVVNIHEADEIDGTPYIALQLLQGYPLDEYLKKKGSPSLPQIMRIGKEMAIGLAAAHKLGLVHRDIKPGNVWLEAPNGRVKILDFGLAKPVEGTESVELTAMGAIVGTPAYMAPEQGRGESLDGRADLFSLGCVLYRLTTGKPPFARSTLMSTLIAIATEEPTPVRVLNPNVPEPLADLIHRLLAKNAADRPANAQAVVKEFESIIAPMQKPGEVIPHVIYAPMAVSVQQINPFADIDTVTDPETAEPQADVAKSPPRKFPAILVGSLVFALIAIVLAGFIVIKITNKDGTVTEVKVPKDSKIEVDGNIVIAGPKKPEVATSTGPDRRAAEWVLSLGGTLQVNGENKWMKDVAELPKEPFRLTGFTLTGNDKVTDAGLGVFKDCKNLMRIALLGSDRLTDAGLVHFKGCNNVGHLDLTSCEQVTDKGLANFKDCKNLTTLSIPNLVLVTDAGLANFKDVETLEQLVLTGCTQVGDAGLAHIKSVKNIQILGLANTRVTDLGLARFKDCSKLLTIIMDVTIVSEAGLANFKECKNLDSLQLYGPKLNDAGLAHFKDCKKLTYLYVYESDVTDAGWAHFKECKSLKHLNLGGSRKITATGLAHFANCKNLTYLSLYGTSATDADLVHFMDCKDLTFINLLKTKVTAAKFEELKKTFPQCKIVSDYGTHEPSSTFKNSIGMEFVKVPKGTGWLGGGAGKQGETKVVIDQDFYLGKYEVTQEEWEAVTGLNPSHFSRNGAGKDAVKDISDADRKRFPVEMVSWDDCQLFIERLNKKEKDTGWVYRLPKEAEWEYACRGGPVDKLESAFDFYFAKPTNTLLQTQANFRHDKGLERTCKVGSYEPNSLGLYDIHGNIWEWCDDTEKSADGALLRVIRSGSCFFLSGTCGAAYRSTNPASRRDLNLGLRLARVPVGPATAVPVPATDPKAAQFMEVHGVSLDAFKEWAAKLPKDYQPSWISMRSSGEVRFDAVATLIPKSREWKLIFVKNGEDDPYYEMKRTHRFARIGNYKVGDKFDYYTLGIFDFQDGQANEYYYGNSQFVGGKIAELIKSTREHNGVRERWLPYSLVAYNNGEGITYQLMSCWQPDSACYWYPELTADELATKIAEYRKKGLRPHIVSVHSNRDDVKFLAVFTEDKTNETWDFTPNLSVADYETQLVERKSKGQRPRCIGSHIADSKVSYTVVWDRVPTGK